MNGPEFTEVEQPFIDQLVLMGWEHTPGSLEDPTVTGRESFREVLLLNDLKDALYRVNLDADPKAGGKPWLDEGRIMQAVNALLRLGTGKLLEANQAATELLLKGTVVVIPCSHSGAGSIATVSRRQGLLHSQALALASAASVAESGRSGTDDSGNSRRINASDNT